VESTLDARQPRILDPLDVAEWLDRPQQGAKRLAHLGRQSVEQGLDEVRRSGTHEVRGELTDRVDARCDRSRRTVPTQPDTSPWAGGARDAVSVCPQPGDIPVGRADAYAEPLCDVAHAEATLGQK
jgi:hypothetical protein